MKIKINADKCLGCGLCVTLCPAVFEFKKGKSHAREKADLEKHQDCIQQAVDTCPVEAISIKVSSK